MTRDKREQELWSRIRYQIQERVRRQPKEVWDRVWLGVWVTVADVPDQVGSRVWNQAAKEHDDQWSSTKA